MLHVFTQQFRFTPQGFLLQVGDNLIVPLVPEPPLPSVPSETFLQRQKFSVNEHSSISQMHSAVASPCEIFTALTQSSGCVSPFVPHWNCHSSSSWMMLPSCQLDGMFLPSFAIRRDQVLLNIFHPLSQLHVFRVQESNHPDLSLPCIPATRCACWKVSWIREWHLTLLLPAEFSAVSTSCCSLSCCSQAGTEMPRQTVQPSARLWDMSLSLHDFDSPLPPVWDLLLHAAVTKKAESGIALAADFRLKTGHWQMVLGLTELVCVLLCSAALSAISCFWFH